MKKAKRSTSTKSNIEWSCNFCPRIFKTDRGRKRHEASCTGRLRSIEADVAIDDTLASPMISLFDRQLRASVDIADSEASQPTVSAVVAQVGGQHYTACAGMCPHCGGAIQHWDLFADAPYLDAQVSRYMNRWREKGQMEDLLKARSFIDKRIKVEEMKARKQDEANRSVEGKDKVWLAV